MERPSSSPRANAWIHSILPTLLRPWPALFCGSAFSWRTVRSTCCHRSLCAECKLQAVTRGERRLNDTAEVELGALRWRLHGGRIAQAIAQAWAIYLRSLWRRRELNPGPRGIRSILIHVRSRRYPGDGVCGFGRNLASVCVDRATRKRPCAALPWWWRPARY